MQRCPKKTKAERVTSEASLYGANEIVKGKRAASYLFQKVTTADKKFL